MCATWMRFSPVSAWKLSDKAYLTGCDQLLIKYNDTTGRPVESWVDVTNIEGGKVKDEDGGPGPNIPCQHPLR